MDIDIESKGIPFGQVIEAARIIPYASDVSVIFKMLFLTGCRMSEINLMTTDMLIEDTLFWRCGKNQKGQLRKIKLPKFYLDELLKYRATNRVYGGRIFGIDDISFRTYFNRDIRPLLPIKWQIKQPIPGRKGQVREEFIFQLKGLRKSYCTLDFAQQMDEWKSSDIALLMTSKKFRHSSKFMTSYHYLCEFKKLEIEKYKRFTPEEILRSAGIQTRLMEFEKMPGQLEVR